MLFAEAWLQHRHATNGRGRCAEGEHGVMHACRASCSARRLSACVLTGSETKQLCTGITLQDGSCSPPAGCPALIACTAQACQAYHGFNMLIVHLRAPQSCLELSRRLVTADVCGGLWRFALRKASRLLVGGFARNRRDSCVHAIHMK